MGVSEGVLALLEAGPRHGYALKLAFEASTGGAWELNVGQVYGVLQRLERDGLVAFDGEEQGRKRYRLTEQGRQRLRRWLVDEPVEHTTATRDELAMKVLLAQRTASVGALEVIAAQRTATMAALQAHTRRKAQVGTDAPLEALVHLDRLILHGRAELDWLDLVEERLADREPREVAPPHPSTADEATGDPVAGEPSGHPASDDDRGART